MQRVTEEYEGKQDNPLFFIQNSFRFSSCTEILTHSRSEASVDVSLLISKSERKGLWSQCLSSLGKIFLVKKNLGIAEDFSAIYFYPEGSDQIVALPSK